MKRKTKPLLADPRSNLFLLRGGNRVLIRMIVDFLKATYMSCLIQFRDVMRQPHCDMLRSERGALQLEYSVTFPAYRGDLNVNMMPFIMTDKSSLPSWLHEYYPLVQNCLRYLPDQGKAVGYLTVHESHVSPGKTQRRPGLHTESPGYLRTSPFCVMTRLQRSGWGAGMYSLRRQIEGGIFMCANIPSTRIWDACVIDDRAIGKGGDIEHLREFLQGEGALAEGLWWMTDSTPHEAVALPHPCDRQFFRLVTSEVSVWYAAHSTPNPTGVKPGRKVIILNTNKFQNQTNDHFEESQGSI